MSLPLPGLELDKMIAHQVLGWHQENVVPGRVWWLNQQGKVRYLKRFSTDIKAAWDLVEKFKLCVAPWIEEWRIYRDGKFLSTPWEGRGWTVHKEGKFLEDGPKNAALTAPHAICLAALNIAKELHDSKWSE